MNRYFLWKRVKRILPTYWILRFISAIFLNKIKDGIAYFILYVIGIEEQAWYVTEILLVYILFFVSAKINRDKIIFVMSIMLVAMSILFYLLGFEARWYNANLLFSLGMIVAYHKELIINWLIKRYFLKVILTTILFFTLAVIFIILKENEYPHDYMKLLAGGMTCILLLQVFIKIELKSSFMIFVGKNSLQLYLIHSNVWTIYSRWFHVANIQLKFCMCTVISLLAVWVYVIVTRTVRKLQNITYSAVEKPQ